MLNSNVKQLINAVISNDLKQARLYAEIIVRNEKTEKSKPYCNGVLKKLEEPVLLELPTNIKNMVTVEMPENFNVRRYYLSERESKLYKQIETSHKVNEKLTELNIRNLNSVLLYGESGIGKTMFARYVAYRLGYPLIYVNFAYLIGSHLGETGKNVAEVLAFAARGKCVLMLDEIDAIASRRDGDSSAADKEMSRVTITLMQALDMTSNEQILMAATNRPDIIDEAIMRRFAIKYEVTPLAAEEIGYMVNYILADIDIDKKLSIVSDSGKQSDIMQSIIAEVIKMVSQET